MGKMHELLAIEGDLQGEFQAINRETQVTFTKKTEHFRGHHKKLVMRNEDRRFEESAAEEIKTLDETVHGKLDYAQVAAIRYLDANLQKESTNQVAVADLRVGDQVLGINLPATFLLGLETKLKAVRDVYRTIPTLAPGVKWIPATDLGEGIYQAETPEVREKTEKEVKYVTAVESTEHHPAQIATEHVVNTVGLFTTTKTCSMLTVAEKSAMLGRIDTLIRACKEARMRANSVDTVNSTLGAELFNFIRKGE